MELLTCLPVKRERWPEGVWQLEYRSEVDGKTDWTLVQPRGSDWLVKLHGHGSSGDQIYTREDLRKNWLPRFLEVGYSLCCPNLRGNAWMSPAAVADLKSLLDYLRSEFKARRFFFYSGSMGGSGNLIYAVVHPEDVSALVALCPATDLESYYRWCRQQKNPPVLEEIATAIEVSYGGPPETNREVYRQHSVWRNANRLTMPVFLVHGNADAIIPVAQSRLLAEKLKGKPDFFYLEIPNGHHDSPLELQEPLFWLEEKRRWLTGD
ncbi:MAG: alpha/beta fold hydrolase [Candidatus Omnitrophica bacterium]|nr:alpha/beta fold hydrolase [Candidatus Omnitrophota bacterium]